MTTIEESYSTCDGYDVRVLLSNGMRHTFHFLTEPADLQAKVDELGSAMVAMMEAEAAEQGSPE